MSDAIDSLQDQAYLKSPTGGETLLSQYRHCSVINEQSLKKAKDIKDLVKINLATVDKALCFD